jgi:protein-tyrosine phosphatase
MARILLVCTGNICRSPIAEGLLRSALHRRGGHMPLVASAGTMAHDGWSATPEAVRAAAELGVDISSHAARKLRPEHVRGADLIMGMAGEHRDAVVDLVPDAAARAFTLKGLVARMDDAVDDADVADPLGLPLDAYRAVARELAGLCERLASSLDDGTLALTARAD